MQCEFCDAEIGEGALACPRCGSPAPPRTAAASHEPPLARLEEDVFALVEETVIVTGEGGVAVAEPASRADASALADTVVPPGANVAPEAIGIDTTLTSGYKGPQGPSVAGAGVQTADDPFGLNVAVAPPTAASPEKRGFDLTSAWNIAAMALVFLLVCAIVIAGLYFGLLRKNGGRSSAPADTVKEFFTMAVEGDAAGAASLATPDSTLSGQVEQLLVPYRRQGSVSLKDFKAKTTESGEAKTSVEITGLDVEVTTDEGVVPYNLLEHTKPVPLPTLIELENRDGKWLITN